MPEISGERDFNKERRCGEIRPHRGRSKVQMFKCSMFKGVRV
jgi:hypothetical protein